MAFFYFYLIIFFLGEISPLKGFSKPEFRWDAEFGSSSMGSIKDSEQSQVDAILLSSGKASILSSSKLGEHRFGYGVSDYEFLASYLSGFFIKNRYYDFFWEGKYSFSFMTAEFFLFQRIYQAHGTWMLQSKNKTDFLDQGHRTISELSFSQEVLGLATALWMQWRRDVHYGLWDASFSTERPRIGFEIHIPVNSLESFIYIINHQKLNFLNQLLDQYRTQFVLIFQHQERNRIYDASFIYDYRESSRIRDHFLLGQEYSLTINLRARQYWTNHLWISCYYNHAAHIGDYPIGRKEGLHQVGVSLDWVLNRFFPKFVFRRQVFNDVFDQVMD